MADTDALEMEDDFAGDGGGVIDHQDARLGEFRARCGRRRPVGLSWSFTVTVKTEPTSTLLSRVKLASHEFDQIF